MIRLSTSRLDRCRPLGCRASYIRPGIDHARYCPHWLRKSSPGAPSLVFVEQLFRKGDVYRLGRSPAPVPVRQHDAEMRKKLSKHRIGK